MSRLKKLLYAIFLSILSFIIGYSIYVKVNIVKFENTQIEKEVRYQLLKQGIDINGKNIMSWDLKKVTELLFRDESYEVFKPAPSDFKELMKIENLQELTIQSLNKDTKNIDVLVKLPNLKILRIWKQVMKNEKGNWIKTPLTNLDFIKGAPKLEDLYIGDCGIEDIESLENIRTIKYLSVSHNHIEDLKVLNTIPNLVEFIAKDNNISDITPLVNKKALIYFELEDNPVEQDDSYKDLWDTVNERRKELGLEIITQDD